MVKRMPALFGALENIRAQRKVPSGQFLLPAFAQGGFVGVPALGQAQAQGAVVVSVNAQAQFDDEQVQAIAEQIAEKNAQRVERALAEGLFDANRRLEREQALRKNRLI
jgi:2-hydroxychromene-2-carboxylate isomerase